MPMGGVDKMDFLLEIFQTFPKMARTQANGNDFVFREKNILYLLHFRSHIAEAPIFFQFEKKETPIQFNTKNRRDVRRIDDVRFDRVNHHPKFDDHQYVARCKFPKCKGKSRTICSKFNVHLCYTKNYIFFLYYHKQYNKY